MAVSQITESQHALFNNLIKKDLTTSNQNNTSNLLSNLGSSTDLSPILSMALCNNYSSNIFSSFANMFSNYLMQMLMMLFLQNLLGNTNTASTSANTQNTAVQDSSCNDGSSAVSPTKEARGVVTLTEDNFNSDLKKQSGTSYVIVCGKGCGRCTRFEPVLKDVNKSLNSDATFYSLTYDDQKSLYTQLKKESGADSTKSYGFPIIIKMVDGKAQDFYSYSDIKNIYTNTEKMTEWFKEKM